MQSYIATYIAYKETYIATLYSCPFLVNVLITKIYI